MRNVILQQRIERDRLCSLEYQRRKVNVNVEDYLKSPLIKLIQGPRRAGKSVLALQILKGNKFAYLDFDDNKLLDRFDEDLVMQVLSEVYPDYKYLLLDEIQNLDGWELWVSKLYRRGVNIIITGSNAHLLSSDLSTSLSGRFLSIEILPFSFEETCDYLNIEGNIDNPQQKGAFMYQAEEYARNGGFPEIIKTRNLTEAYLQGVYDTVILKDIIQRYKIRNVSDLYNIAEWLISNFTNQFTISSLKEELGFASKNTLANFCRYLENSYMFFYLPRFNNKLKIMKKAASKVYVVDNGFIKAKAFSVSDNIGRLLENMVFVELVRRGYAAGKTLFYYRSSNDREVDFVTRKGNKVECLIQVCYDMSSPSTQAREFKALQECGKELHCSKFEVVTWDSQQTILLADNEVSVVPFYKWVASK